MDERSPWDRAAASYRLRYGESPGAVAFAPGRVNLIGEHTDYNQGYVLPCAIELGIAAAVGEGHGGLFALDLGEEAALDGCAGESWAAYPRGIAWALAEAGQAVPAFQMVVTGTVPRGSGLSSSAALECATALALDSLFGLDLDRRQLARLGQRAENGYVGVQSGIMDQYASLLCRADHALLLDCRSRETRDIPLRLRASGLVLLICDTGSKRTLAGSGYNERRAECERAAARLGVSTLRQASTDELDGLDGVELRRARHVVTENARVLAAAAAMERDDFEELGRLMFQSHASLRDDYEVSTPALDGFVQIAQLHGALGARLTGAGFGGCALALLRQQDVPRLQAAVVAEFDRQRWERPAFLAAVPSDGARLPLRPYL